MKTIALIDTRPELPGQTIGIVISTYGRTSRSCLPRSGRGSLLGESTIAGSVVERDQQSANQINQLPQALMSSAAALKSGAETQAKQHPPIWQQALMLILVSILTALLVLGGRPTFEHFLPDHEQLQQAANFGHAVWDKATPQERARLNEIINRSAK